MHRRAAPCVSPLMLVNRFKCCLPTLSSFKKKAIVNNGEGDKKNVWLHLSPPFSPESINKKTIKVMSLVSFAEFFTPRYMHYSLLQWFSHFLMLQL